MFFPRYIVFLFLRNCLFFGYQSHIHGPFSVSRLFFSYRTTIFLAPNMQILLYVPLFVLTAWLLRKGLTDSRKCHRVFPKGIHIFLVKHHTPDFRHVTAKITRPASDVEDFINRWLITINLLVAFFRCLSVQSSKTLSLALHLIKISAVS